MQRAHNSVLHVLGEHDDEARVLLPHHAPEVLHGVVQRRLARDVVVADVAGALEAEVTRMSHRFTSITSQNMENGNHIVACTCKKSTPVH